MKMDARVADVQARTAGVEQLARNQQKFQADLAELKEQQTAILQRIDLLGASLTGFTPRAHSPRSSVSAERSIRWPPSSSLTWRTSARLPPPRGACSSTAGRSFSAAAASPCRPRRM